MPFLYFKFYDRLMEALFLSLGQIAILFVLANYSSYFHIWQHLVCNLDLFCRLLPFLAYDMSVFVSAL